MQSAYCIEHLEDRRLLSAPVVVASGYDYERNPHKLWLQFDQDVSASLSTADVRVDLVSSDDPGPSLASWAWDAATLKATFSFPGILPDGNYRAVVSAEDVENSNDEHLAADHVLDFFFFKADMVGRNAGPRDRVVSLPDWNRLAANWGQSDRTYSQGDLNYDTLVNMQDFNILASKFGANLAAPPTAPDQLVLSTLSDSEIRLNWIDYVVGEEGYRVQWSMDGAVFTTLENIEANADFYLADDLEEGTRYWFRVRAYGNGADTAYTPKVAETTVLLAPSDLRVVTYVANQRKLTWTDNSDAEDEFIVERSANGIDFTEIGRAPENATSFIDEDPPPGTLHSYRVRATNTRTDSAPSNQTSPVGDQEESLGRAGTLDTGFGSGGFVLASAPSWYEVYDVCELSTGDLVALAFSNSSGFKFYLLRFNAQGVRDMSFGVGGIVNISYATNTLGQIDVQDDDKIVFAGMSTTGDFLSARFLANGQVDTTFSGGYVQVDIGSNAVARAVSIQPDDGKIVLAGWSAPTGSSGVNATLARLNPNGTLDTGFGNQGIATSDFGYSNTRFHDVAIDGEGRIVAVGAAGQVTYSDVVAIARFTPAGVSDTTFGAGGERVIDLGPFTEWAYAVTVQPDGKVVVGGQHAASSSSYLDSFLLRLSSSGTLDTSFGSGGITISSFSSQNDYVFDLALQADGKILASISAPWDHPVAARYTADGQLDGTFADGGSATLPSGVGLLARTVYIQRDGKIIVGATRPNLVRLVGVPKVNLIAHRTGGKLFEQLSDEVENSGDPTKYLVLTNNDFEEGDPLGGRDYDNDLGWIPTGSEGDDDLAQITLKKLHNSLTDGTFKIELSDPTAVRLFDHNGNMLYEPGTTDPDHLQFDLADPLSPPTEPAEYLSGVMNGDVDIWLEGLHTDPDFTFKIAYLDANDVEVARDTVHITLAEWTFRDAQDDEVVAVEPMATEVLRYVADNAASYQGGGVPGSAFKVRLEGLFAVSDTSLTISSEPSTAETAEDLLMSDVGGCISVGAFGLYSSALDEDILDTSSKDALRNQFKLGVVHNPKAKIELKRILDRHARIVEAPNLRVEIEGDIVRVGTPMNVTLTVTDPNPNLKYVLGIPGAGAPVVGTTATFNLLVTEPGLQSIYAFAQIQDSNGNFLGAFYGEAAGVAVPANISNEGFQWSEKAWALLRPSGDVVPNYPSLPTPSISTSELLALNNRISAAYAHFYNLKPDVYKWAGLAAYVSPRVGGQAIVTSGFLDQAARGFARLLDAQPPQIFEKLYRAATRLNFTLFWNTIPQHFAFEGGGMPAVERMVADGLAIPDQVEAWRLIQQGIDAGAVGDQATKRQKVWEGTVEYTDVEQNITAQQIYDEVPNKELFAILTNDNWFKTQLRSPVPGDNSTFGDVVPTGVNGGPANVAVKEDRWKWISTPDVGILDKWRAWSDAHDTIPLSEITTDAIEAKAIIQNLPPLNNIMDLIRWVPPTN